MGMGSSLDRSQLKKMSIHQLSSEGSPRHAIAQAYHKYLFLNCSS